MQYKNHIMASINIKFEQKDLKPLILENIKLGDSILEICLDNNINLHHNCGGVCACSTCHIYINKGMDFLPELTDKEENFIDRAVSPTIISRLGCQCLVENQFAEIDITLPDQTQFLGE